MSPEAEKERYLHHRNRIDDPEFVGYFERFLADSVVSLLHPECKALDFGSGPEPVLAQLLKIKYDMDVAVYDPYFANDANVFEDTYDLITCTEVIEHLKNPVETFALFSRLLRNGGHLAIMTQFHPNDENDFLQWFYPRDITHIGFFAERTFAVLAERFHFALVSTNHFNTITFRKNEEIQP
ncbi:MAG: class I SAM-dependent methyltransferase [Bacillus subtilis]|nr:class I SAM-dependent methyltransferase [Bacillus subtilis]